MSISRFVAAMLAASVLLAGCMDRESPPTSPAGAGIARDLQGGGLPGLLTCSPLAADSAMQIIGPAGGTISVGPHTLVVPPGALDSATTITAVAPSDTLNRIQFGPHGLTFNVPAQLTMSYANCGLTGVIPPLEVVYTGIGLEILEVLAGTPSSASPTLIAPIQHFSDYVVAW